MLLLEVLRYCCCMLALELGHLLCSQGVLSVTRLCIFNDLMQLSLMRPDRDIWMVRFDQAKHSSGGDGRGPIVPVFFGLMSVWTPLV